MPSSWLPPGGENLFQEIKKVCQEAEASGQTLYRLSIGQPLGPALESARMKAAEYTQSNKEGWHEYQDNGCVLTPDFAQRFSQFHTKADLSKYPNLSYLPIPGIKPMLGLLPLACGLGKDGQELMVGSMTNPGYPVPETWARYLRVAHYSFWTNPDNAFRPDLEREGNNFDVAHLVMFNFPHNPSGQIATREYWQKVCAYCAEHGMRLFNDGAYLALAHDENCCA
ncbi:MAG TPA: aminotransferase class I/II-fold pyridoxal phosphate-dependent enzyme, partial [Candidatus Paceibacterota bacterium]|nr:aminotransferase class I/II-fold pyridoxal phosphate-dependent enzyme [Candidatus Paceibacterota bacterium]